MKSYINNIVSLEHSILGNHLKNFDKHWDFIANLSSLIIEVGKNLNKNEFDEVAPNVWINKKAKVDKTARIIGPCIIDEGAEIRINAFFRGNTVIGKRCVIGNSSELKNSILFDEAKIPHFNYIGDSIVGYKAHFGAGSITSNIKSDESLIKIKLNGHIYNTNRKKVGALVGDFVEIGCNSVLSPGVIIGTNTTIYPLTMVRGVIEENKIVKSMDNIVNKENL